MYCFMFVIVTFGLFNLMNAVFVESTMTAALQDEKRGRRLKYLEHIRTAERLQQLVLRFCYLTEHSIKTTRPSGIKESVWKSWSTWSWGNHWRNHDLELGSNEMLLCNGLEVELTRDQFKTMVGDHHIERLIDELDVHIADHVAIF